MVRYLLRDKSTNEGAYGVVDMDYLSMYTELSTPLKEIIASKLNTSVDNIVQSLDEANLGILLI